MCPLRQRWRVRWTTSSHPLIPIRGQRPPHRLRGITMSNRFRSSIRRLAMLGLFLLAVPLAVAQNFSEVRPSPQQVAWQDLEFGVIVHFNPNTWLDQEWGDGTASPSVFNPTQVDPGQWARA